MTIECSRCCGNHMRSECSYEPKTLSAIHTITGSLNASHMTFGNVVRVDLATGAIERLPGFTTTDDAALAFWDAVERLKGER